MTDTEKQIIRSTFQTLLELIYKLLKEKEGLGKEEITLLSEYENALIENIERLN